MLFIFVWRVFEVVIRYFGLKDMVKFWVWLGKGGRMEWWVVVFVGWESGVLERGLGGR